MEDYTFQMIPKNDGLRDFFIFILRSHINILFSIPKLFPKTNSHY